MVGRSTVINGAAGAFAAGIRHEGSVTGPDGRGLLGTGQFLGEADPVRGNERHCQEHYEGDDFVEE